MEKWFAKVLKTVLHYKSLTAGVLILFGLVMLSLYAFAAYPYDSTVKIWNDISPWEDYPKLARPAWIKYFTSVRELEGTIVLDSRKPDVYTKVRIPIIYGTAVRGVYIYLTTSFNYNYDSFPSQIACWLFINSSQDVRITIEWVKPEGTSIKVYEGMLPSGSRYFDLSTTGLDFVQEFYRYIVRRFNATPSYVLNGLVALMGREDEGILRRESLKPSKGVYTVIVKAESPDATADINIKLNIYGTLYGLAGTDHRRRDLFIAVVWGAPIALSFGLAAAVAISFIQMFIAALAAWRRGFLEILIERVNEIFMILPFLPTVIMISLFYSLSLWHLLLIVIALGIWGGGLKTYRAMFLQVRESPYIEAALAYGASGLRIVVRYMIPRVLPMIIPSIVISVPDYVFLEAVLALMGVVDPRVISWGRVLEEAFDEGALYKGYYHLVLVPASMLVVVSIAFALIGFTLDRILNPRLKER